MEFQSGEDLFLKCALPNGGRTLEMWNAPILSRFMACHQKAGNKRYYVINVDIDKHWATPQNVDFMITIQYLHFLYFQLCFHGADSILRMDVSSGLASEEVAPEIKLKSCVQNYRPTEAKVTLSARDIGVNPLGF